MKKTDDSHPAIYDLQSKLQHGNLSRREFLRFSVLLGLSFSAASHAIQMACPKDVHAVSYGGKLRVSGLLKKISHPAELSWVAYSHPLRLVAETLTYTDENNITHPFLLEKWKVGEDLRTWTLYLKKGIFFNNGDTLTTEDVAFSFKQWLNPRMNASTQNLFGSYLDASGIEIIDRYLIRLHLKRPEIAVPEHLFHFPAVILNHRTFEGDFLKAPHGTGPFTMALFEENERCLLKKRHDYWQPGLPVLDEVEIKDLGHAVSQRISALVSGEVDLIDISDLQSIEIFDALKGEKDIRIHPVASSRTALLRMRADTPPWNDNSVRRAMKLCQHREKLLYLAFSGQGLIGQDCHVHPNHPEYCQKPQVKFDPIRAKSLLASAGYPDGLDVELIIGDQWTEIERYAQILQKDAARGGFRIHIRRIPGQRYLENRTVFDFGITPWRHYPLGIMALQLAYAIDETGTPGSWNETRWVDEEFTQLLAQAGGTLDVSQRKKLFCRLEDIQIQRGAIGIAWWQNTWVMAHKKVRDVIAHPGNHLNLNRVWLVSEQY